jgi:phosphate transport system substrate-binding protein
MRVSVSVMLLGLSAAIPTTALSEQVELRLPGEDFVVKGDLVSTSGDSAIISSPNFGIIMVEPSRYICTGPGCAKLTGQTSDAVSIQGSNTIGEALTPALIDAYAAEKQMRVEKQIGASSEEVGIELKDATGRQLAKIDLRSHGSGTAFPALAKGEAQIGASSRPIKPEEEKSITDAGFALQPHVLALDGILVLVSPNNPVNQLSLEQIAKIFAGEVTDWVQVGGVPGEIKLYARDGRSGTYDTFDALVLKPAKVKISEKAARLESSIELSDNVARDPNAIGFAGFAYLRNAKALAIRSVCGLTNRPTEFNVKTEEYALGRRLFYYTTDKMTSPVGKALLDYVLSDASQQTITETGFISQAVDFLPFGKQEERVAFALTAPPDDFDAKLMQELMTQLKGSRRMSITYRFEKNSGALELKAKQDIPRLARFLKSPPMRGKQILLLGFADASGTFPVNLALSHDRAASVRTALLAAGQGAVDPGKIVIKAYGELMPVDCNNTEDGQAKNRRVEVWVKG